MKMAETQKKGQVWVPKYAPLDVHTDVRAKQNTACLLFFLFLTKKINDANNGKRVTGHSPMR